MLTVAYIVAIHLNLQGRLANYTLYRTYSVWNSGHGISVMTATQMGIIALKAGFEPTSLIVPGIVS